MTVKFLDIIEETNNIETPVKKNKMPYVKNEHGEYIFYVKNDKITIWTEGNNPKVLVDQQGRKYISAWPEKWKMGNIYDGHKRVDVIRFNTEEGETGTLFLGVRKFTQRLKEHNII